MTAPEKRTPAARRASSEQKTNNVAIVASPDPTTQQPVSSTERLEAARQALTSRGFVITREQTADGQVSYWIAVATEGDSP